MTDSASAGTLQAEAAAVLLGVLAVVAACGDPPTETPRPAVEEVDVRPEAVAGAPGATFALSARVRASGGAPEDVRWSSGDPAVAAVDSTGDAIAYVTVTADSLGLRTRVRAVSAFDSTKADSSRVESTFACPAWGAGVLPGDTTLSAIGDSVHVRARANGCGTDYCPRFQPCGVEADSAFRWTSSDTGVASVDSLGVVTAEGQGTARVEARFLGDGGQHPEAEVRVDTTG